MVKAQVSVEQLMSYAGLMAMLIPLTLLFLTLTSINQEKIEYDSFRNSLDSLARVIEYSYSLCSEEQIKRKVSLRFPPSVHSLSFLEQGGEYFLRVELKDGSSILKDLGIPAGSPRVSFVVDRNIGNIEGNQVLYIECEYTLSEYRIRVSR